MTPVPVDSTQPQNTPLTASYPSNPNTPVQTSNVVQPSTNTPYQFSDNHPHGI